MSEETLIGIVAIGALFGLPMLLGGITIVTNHMRQARADEVSAALKKEMIERGFTAEEIVQVIAAGTGDEAAAESSHPAKTG